MKNIAIFASGGGTNAENIVRTFHSGSRIRVAVCVINRRNAGVVARMEALHIPVLYFPNEVWAERPSEIVDALKPYDIDLIALAGFLREVRPEILDAYSGKVLNIHPALLPSFGGKGMYGHKVHEAVIAAGEQRSGATVHFATSEIDGGSIVMQGIVDLSPDETPDSLADKVHEVEMELYPRAIVKVLSEQDKPAVVPPPTPASVPPPTPIEQWAEALHMPIPKQDAPEQAVNVEISTEPAEQTVDLQTGAPQTDNASSHVTPPAYHQPQAPQISEQSDAMPYGTIHFPSENNDCSDAPQKAKSYLVLSIIFMLIFGILLGIIPLIYSLRTRSLNAVGDYARAQKMSNIAQGWLIAEFCLGTLFMTLYTPMLIAMTAFI